MTGKDYYERGRDEYRHNDWVNAHKDFQAAIDNGYSQKPSLTEDSAGQYLARMDSTKSNTGVAKVTPRRHLLHQAMTARRCDARHARGPRRGSGP